MPLLHGSKQSLWEPDGQWHKWKQLLRWFIYHWNVGTWRVWVSLGWITPGDFFIPPTMNQGGIQRICGKGIPKHCIMDGYRLHSCHEHCWNAWKSCLCVVFCACDEACHVINKVLILPQIFCCPCIQLLIGLVWILRLVDIYISGKIQSFKCVFKYLLGCQQRRLLFILILQDNIGSLMLTMSGLCRLRCELG